ncbi:MAG: hypothetical protein V7K97_20150 [Nostoc sp.]|uniref:hypothetical protein n=1 Tax=Nostoc sp. TaxID=1180 RepID=UPI002FF957F9
MSLEYLVNHAVDKQRFQTIPNYITFCRNYLQFIATGLQARIVSQNENHYQFYQYGINATFLPGHFKAYTIKLNPLDGIYYCDIRPNMITDGLLSQHIQTIDNLFYRDIWQLLSSNGQSLEEVEIEEGENEESE